MGVEPVPDAPAAVATTGEERALVVADYHAGLESVLRSEGVEIESRSEQRRRRLQGLLAETDPERLVILGDLVHAIGDPWDREREEIQALFDAMSVPVTLVKGNHDGDIEPVLAEIDHDISVSPPGGIRLGGVGFAHGHTWPTSEVLAGDVLCVGHEHPVVRLADEVGGYRLERVWLRGGLDAAVFPEGDSDGFDNGEGAAETFVVCPAFNDLSGGTWVNVEGQEFLSPFLPAGLVDGEAYMLDGTRLGAYRSVSATGV